MDYPLTIAHPDGNLPRRYSKEFFEAYKAEQQALRNKINARCLQCGKRPVFTCPVDDFSKFAIIPLCDNQFKIVKREEPIDIVEFDNDGRAAVIANLTRSTSDRIGLNKKRGKYNDGARLFDSDSSSIELGEVQGNGGGGWNG